MYRIEFASEVYKDIKDLKLTKPQIIKLKQKIEQIAENPLPKTEGGLGEPLKGSLGGYLKFRFDSDYRVVYKLIRENDMMRVVVIGLRSDKLVYNMAVQRLKK